MAEVLFDDWHQMKGLSVCARSLCHCLATRSEGGAFMKPPPFERLIHGEVWNEIFKNAVGDWETIVMCDVIYVCDINHTALSSS